MSRVRERKIVWPTQAVPLSVDRKRNAAAKGHRAVRSTKCARDAAGRFRRGGYENPLARQMAFAYMLVLRPHEH